MQRTYTLRDTCFLHPWREQRQIEGGEVQEGSGLALSSDFVNETLRQLEVFAIAGGDHQNIGIAGGAHDRMIRCRSIILTGFVVV